MKSDTFCVCFYGWAHAEKFTAAFCGAGFRIVGHLSFPKPYVSGKRYLAYQHEAEYLLVKGRPATPAWALADVIAWKDYPANELHPTEKPLSVLTPLIEAFSQPGDIVADPFAGSGSTLMAAKMLGRDYIGVELDAEYHAIARHRLGAEFATAERGSIDLLSPKNDRREASAISLISDVPLASSSVRNGASGRIVIP